MTPLAGALGLMFGVCCNAMSADGRVVDFGYGCGAHSDTPAPQLIGSPAYEPYDDGVLEVADVAPASEAPSAELDAPQTLEAGEAVAPAEPADG
jgi:hypothetical protein